MLDKLSPDHIKVVYYDCPKCHKENIFGRPLADRVGFNSTQAISFTCKRCHLHEEIMPAQLAFKFTTRSAIEAEYGPVAVLPWLDY